MTDDGVVVLPALLRAARGAYARAIRARLAEAGFDDVPRTGAFILGGMANHGAPLEGLVRELGGRKPQVAAMLDALVEGGYLDPAHELTDRGRAAAGAVRAGVQAVDGALATRLGPEGVAGLRAGLIALIEVREEMEDADRASS